MGFDIWNFCLYENSCYLVEHIKATDATFLCSKSEVNWLKNKNVNVVLPISEIILQNGNHSHNLTNFDILTSHFSIISSLRKSIHLGLIEECLLYLKTKQTNKKTKKLKITNNSQKTFFPVPGDSEIPTATG